MTTRNLNLAAAQKLEEIHAHARNLLGMVEKLAAFAPHLELNNLKAHAETAMTHAKQLEEALRAHVQTEVAEEATEVEQSAEQTADQIEDQVENEIEPGAGE